MAAPCQKGFWPRCWRVVRWCRVSILMATFLVLGGGILLMQLGLPAPVKNAIVRELRGRGMDLDFDRLRLRWNGGVVADSVRLAKLTDPNGARIRVDQVVVDLNHAALKQFRLEVDALRITRGRVVLPLVVTNEAPREIALSNVVVQLHFQPGDRWELDQAEAEFLGIKLNASASLTNVSIWRRQPASIPRAPTGNWQRQLLALAREADRWDFSKPPELNLLIQGDARDPASFNARLNLQVEQGRAPGMAIDDGLFTAQWSGNKDAVPRARAYLAVESLGLGRRRYGPVKASLQLLAGGTNLVPHEAQWELQVPAIREAAWSAKTIRLAGSTVRESDDNSTLRTTAMLNVARVQTGGHALTNTFVALAFQHDLQSLLPESVDMQWSLTDARTPWGSASEAKFTGTVTRLPPEKTTRPNPNWGWWANLAPYAIRLRADLRDLEALKVKAESAQLELDWQAPNLRVTKFLARFSGGELEATAGLNVASRGATASLQSSLDLREMILSLMTNQPAWLTDLTWSQSPRLEATARLALPAWTERAPDWKTYLPRTLALEGSIAVTNAAFRGLELTSLRGNFGFTNQVLSWTDLTANRPEGKLRLTGSGKPATREFRTRIDSDFDPMCVAPLVPPPARKAFYSLRLSAPPQVSGEVWGRWDAPETLAAKVRFALTNSIIRNQPMALVTADASYTNLYLVLTNLTAIRVPGEEARASGMGFDIPRQTLYFTNGVSTMNPYRFTEAIGPKTAHTMLPYQFAYPPLVKVHGSLVVTKKPQADLYFDLAGNDFTYWRFHVPEASGLVHWHGDMLSISNLQARFYGGRLKADFLFDLSPRGSANFNFTAKATDTNLKLLMADLVTATNHFAGSLDASLNITSANSSDWESWNGNGVATLRDGFLWDIPMFGIFTPVLNSFAPGLGSSPLHAGKATFVITNSVIDTEDLEIRSPAMRLFYRGTVDFNGRVNARAEASVLRDMWVVGRVFSLAFLPIAKLFEYRV
ncbi:MAG TPA: AsmA-like C-terminal region-containing protein, partial [Verrucomicrobiae bacterium]|nr:AsmA-like C-terminal region-containing protein [Verrucomicrobiae bacterium]